ncbi:MAG TPA: hypothetical protein PKC30_13470 [Saprospiraceae bacterium]|nr:hypothetical protein [Saprospiraceae bacterium]
MIGSILMISAGCHSHDDELSDIEIRFITPQNGDALSNASNVMIRVEIEADPENHDIDIVLYPHNNNSNKIVDWHRHTHDQLVIFSQAVDLSSFSSGTVFHLDVEACRDHDCETKARAGIEFSIQ